MRNLYFSFVYPYLTYCVEVWGNTHATYLDLIKLQKKCVRVITFSHYLEHTPHPFKQLDILSFTKLVVQRISLLMFKHHIGITSLPTNNHFIENTTQHVYYTRQINNLQTPIGNNEKVYKLFSFHGINIWNHISRKITTDVSYACYKNLSKRFIQGNTIPYRIK